MNLARPRRGRNLVILAAVVIVGGLALADALRDQFTAEATPDGGTATTATTDESEVPTLTEEAQDGGTATATTTEEVQDGETATAATSDEREAPELRLPGMAAPGFIAFTDPPGCELRVFDIRADRFADVPPLPTSCYLSAPRVGTSVAYGLLEDWNGSERPFSVRDVEDPRASFGDYKAILAIAWSPDGSKLAWCDTPRSGFELSLGQRPKRLDHCPRAYDPRGVTASVNNRQQILVGGRPLLKARGFVWDLAWGVDGSLAVLVDGRRVDRYEGGRLVGSAMVPPSTPAHPRTIVADFAPDNCAALSVGYTVVRLVDLGCFRGQAPQMFQGAYAAWSPDGEWIAVAEPDAVVFHRVVGGEATVRWEVAVGQFAWLRG